MRMQYQNKEQTLQGQVINIYIDGLVQERHEIVAVLLPGFAINW